MKLNGFVGKGTGKLGSSVFAVSGGEQIVRQYNPNISNPSTDAQVEQRAKLKLMSQLAAALAPGLAIKKQGLTSARNIFVKNNIRLAQYQDDEANVNAVTLQLTDSQLGLPDVAVSSAAQGQISAALAQGAGADISRVVYVVAKYNNSIQLTYVSSTIVSQPGANRTFPTTISVDASEVIVYAYGVKDTSSSASISYQNYEIPSGEEIATLTVLQGMMLAGATFTETKGATLSLE